MTKEELAKKKGIKTIVKTQTAAESILTNKPTTPILNTSSDLVPVISNKEEKLEKNNKAGRPKGKPHTKISLNIPNEYLELINIATGINYKGNTSSYIVSLIKKDIEANGKIYEQIRAMKTIGSI